MRARTCVPSAFEAAMTSGLPPLKRFRWVQPTAFRGHLKSFGSSFAAEAGNQESIGPRLLPVPSEMVNSIDTRQLHWKTTVPQKIPITMSRKSLLTVDFGRCLMFASRIYPIFYGEWVVGRKDTLDFCPVVVHYLSRCLRWSSVSLVSLGNHNSGTPTFISNHKSKHHVIIAAAARFLKKCIALHCISLENNTLHYISSFINCDRVSLRWNELCSTFSIFIQTNI